MARRWLRSCEPTVKEMWRPRTGAGSQRSSCESVVPTPEGMSDARAGAWVAGRPAAAIRWVARLRGAELPNELTAMIVIALLGTGGMLLVSFLPISDQQPSGVLAAARR
jgi:hypothetical protein